MIGVALGAGATRYNPGGSPFVYGTTLPALGSNVGNLPGVALTPVSSFTPASDTTYTNVRFNCYVNLAGISNAQFINCKFCGPLTGSASWNPKIIDSTHAGGNPGAVVGYWGAVGQNYFKFCEFGGTFVDSGGSGLLFDSLIFGKCYYLDRCTLLGGVDNSSANNVVGGQNLYVEARGCVYGQLDGRYPDPTGTHADGTHNDSCELTSGSYAYWLGCLFDARMNPNNTTSPYYFVKNEQGANIPPLTLSQPNSCLALLQNTDTGQSGTISHVEIDQNWFSVTRAGPIQIDEKGHGALTNLKITNNRCFYDGVVYSLSTINGWGGKYAHAVGGTANTFTNLSASAPGASQATLAHASNDFSGNIDVINGKTILSPYRNAPT